MTALDLASLRAAAEGATPGHWRWTHGMDSRAMVLADDETFRVRVDGHADAAHIAAFDQPTVLALLDRLEAAEAKVARVEALADRFDALAARPGVVDGPHWTRTDQIGQRLRAVLDGADS